MRELDARHLDQAQLAGHEHAAMPGDDPVLAVEQDRVGETGLPDAAGGRMLPAICATWSSKCVRALRA